jgi:hypothetical protein
VDEVVVRRTGRHPVTLGTARAELSETRRERNDGDTPGGRDGSGE